MPHLFGWCSPTDQYHAQCKKQYKNSRGETVKCECPRHKRRAIPPRKKVAK